MPVTRQAKNKCLWQAALGLLVCIANPLVVVGAEQFFERAGVTKTINDASVLPRKTKAVPGDVITKDLALKTGGDSRAELEFPDLTITRVGSNALFRFIAGQRRIILDGGVMLFHAQKGVGGGTVEAGTITAAATGTDFLISYVKEPTRRGSKAEGGRVKVICLTGRVLVYFTAKPKIRSGLKPGQMVDVPPGATKMPAATTVSLTTLLATSMLGAAGGLGPFPNQAAIAKNASQQEKTSVPANAPLAANVTQAAQTARSAAAAGKPLPPPLPAPAPAPAPAVAQAAKQAAEQAAAQQAAQRAVARQVARQIAAQQAAQQAAAQQAAAEQAAAQQAAAAQQQAAAAAGANQGNQGNQGKHLGQMK